MDKKMLVCQRKDFIGVNDFWEKVDALYKQGYEYCKGTVIDDSASMFPFPRVFLVKREVEKEVLIEVEAPVLEENVVLSVEDMNMAQLKDYAKENGIKIPHNISKKDLLELVSLELVKT